MPQICGNKQSNLRIPITGHLGRQGIHSTQIPKEGSEVTVKSDEYRCEAYVILSFHRAVRWVPPALAVGRKSTIRRSDRSIRPRIRSRSQKPRTSIGTTDRNGESNPIQMLFRFSVDEDSIDGMFDHAVQSGHMPCRRKAEQLIEALARARKEPAW